jgi:pimeloyl-ACP methyl ester carboxylesterase
VPSAFTPSHRGGAGPPLVCLHGFTDTWRIWELVLPKLERHHDVLAPTLPGHAGGPPLPRRLGAGLMADAVERAMDEAGLGTAHLAGNSLGGFVALQLAARGRAESVVALAPAGGWAAGDASWREAVGFFATLHEGASRRRPTPTPSRPARRGGGARRGSSSSAAGTSPPSWSSTRCWGPRAATSAP